MTLKTALGRVNDLLWAMSKGGPERPENWTEEEVADNPKWVAIRSEAKKALLVFDEELDATR